MTSAKVAGPRKRTFYAKSAAVFRWVHIYLSMLGFATLMFFAFTGITLNHPTWFGAGEQSIRDVNGNIPQQLLATTADVASGEDGPAEPDRLSLAEWLRAEHQLRGRVTEFSADDFEYMVVFKGPGYSADVFIDRESGSYSLTETSTGVMAVLNDLHKGRDTGTEWAWVIDISAVITLLLSVSGFGLLFYIRRRRVTGILTAVAGTVLLVAAWAIWVP